MVYGIRKANIEKLVLDKFRGNKSAFARATMVHPNHINLILSSNPDHSRNLGENLARKIEAQLGLPSSWLDHQHDASSSSSHQVDAIAIHESLAGAVRTCDRAVSVVIPMDRVKAVEKRLTAVENVILAVVDTHDMEPEIAYNDPIMIDTGVKAVTVDGVYVLVKSGVALLRRFSRSSLGDLVIVDAKDGSIAVTPAMLKTFKVAARVVVHLKVTHL